MRRAAAVLVLAVIATVAAPAEASEREDAIVAAMGVPAKDLSRALATSPWRDDPLFLAAVAQNRAATSEILGAITRRGDGKLHEKLHASERLLGKNRKGLAVMRLVALHPNVTEATLVQGARRRQRRAGAARRGDGAEAARRPREVRPPRAWSFSW